MFKRRITGMDLATLSSIRDVLIKVCEKHSGCGDFLDISGLTLEYSNILDHSAFEIEAKVRLGFLPTKGTHVVVTGDIVRNTTSGLGPWVPCGFWKVDFVVESSALEEVHLHFVDGQATVI